MMTHVDTNTWEFHCEMEDCKEVTRFVSDSHRSCLKIAEEAGWKLHRIDGVWVRLCTTCAEKRTVEADL